MLSPNSENSQSSVAVLFSNPSVLNLSSTVVLFHELSPMTIVRVVNNRLGLSYSLSLLFFFSIFPFILFLVFILLFSILNLDEECDVTLCVMVTQVTNCDGSMTHVTVTYHIIL